MTLLLPALRYCAVASIVLVLVLAATAVSLNLSAARPIYAWAASQALNRDVQIAGPVSLRLGTVTTLSMNGITIAGTTDTTPVFARIDSAVAQIAPIPLLHGALHFTALSVADVSLFIDIDEQGQGNWPAAIDENFTPADGSQERPAYQLRATEVRLERVHAQIQSAGNKRQDAISVEALTQTLVADDLQLIARGTFNHSPYEVTLAGEGIHSLLDVQDWKIEMQGTVGAAQFQLSTAIPSLEQIMRSKVDASVRADSANAILQALDLPSINDGPVDLAVSARHSDDRQRIKLDAKFGDLQLAGTADHALATAWESVRLAVNAHGTSLSHLGALWNKPNLPETPFDIDLAASLEGSELNVETLQLSSEAITLSLTGRLPAYRSLGTGNLSGTIDVPALGAFGNLLDLPS
ncbi:MAG: AsmA family protein, partial [Halieaceae bacterium]